MTLEVTALAQGQTVCYNFAVQYNYAMFGGTFEGYGIHDCGCMCCH